MCCGTWVGECQKNDNDDDDDDKLEKKIEKINYMSSILVELMKGMI